MSLGAYSTQYVVQAFVRSGPGVRVSQLALLAFVTSATASAPPDRGVNTGTPISQPYPIHLDRKCRVAGTYSDVTGKTTFVLPIDDSTLTTGVLAATAFGNNNGRAIALTYKGSGTFEVLGDYSAGAIIVGRPYTMSIELSRPYRHDFNGNVIVSDRLQHSIQYFAYHNTGDFTVRVSMPNRADRTKAFTVSAPSALSGRGELRTLFTGWAEQNTFKIESSSPRPVTISSIKYTVQIGANQG